MRDTNKTPAEQYAKACERTMADLQIKLADCERERDEARSQLAEMAEQVKRMVDANIKMDGIATEYRQRAETAERELAEAREGQASWIASYETLDRDTRKEIKEIRKELAEARGKVERVGEYVRSVCLDVCGPRGESPDYNECREDNACMWPAVLLAIEETEAPDTPRQQERGGVMHRSTPHSIRFSVAEWRRICTAAERLGVPPATLVRSAALAAAREVGLPEAVAAEIARTLGEWIQRLPEGQAPASDEEE